MEERAKEEDKGLELMKQEESRFEGKRNKTKQREEKEEKEQDLPLLPGYPSSLLLRNSGHFHRLLAFHVLSITHYDHPLAADQAIGAVDQYTTCPRCHQLGYCKGMILDRFYCPIHTVGGLWIIL